MIISIRLFNEQGKAVKGIIAEVNRVCSYLVCWSAAKYVSDCHDCGALSDTRSLRSWVYWFCAHDYFILEEKT